MLGDPGMTPPKVIVVLVEKVGQRLGVVDLREAFHAFVILNTRCFHLVHELCLKVSYLLP